MKRAGVPSGGYNNGKGASGGSSSNAAGAGGAPQQPAKKGRFDEDYDTAAMFEEADFGDEEGGMTYERVETIDTDEKSEFASGKWIREREATGWDVKEKPLMFHWLDIDMVSGAVLDSNPSGGRIIGSTEGPVPIIRLYGVTQEGFSVMACIHGFTPYFYASVSGLPAHFPDEALAALRVAMDNKLREKARGAEDKTLKSFCLGIQRTEPLQSLVGYHADEKKTFLKVRILRIISSLYFCHVYNFFSHSLALDL